MAWSPLAPPRRRFAGWFVALGLVVAAVVIVGGIVLGEIAGSFSGNDNYSAVSVVYFGAVGALLITGIVLACVSGLSPRWRGLGLGLVIGWFGTGLAGVIVAVFILLVIASSGQRAV